ncbi:MAG: S-methyl-5-thioribose-1-phosphate isomerase [bacterium]|nr:MAG: S-methyl-5-thioribose-1-phosphate isomerase [bacterium]
MVLPTVDYRAGRVTIIDQTLLPAEESLIRLSTLAQVAEAIRTLRVRGAPAIGITAAYGMLLELENLLASLVVDPPGYFFDRNEGMGSFPGGGLETARIRKTLAEARTVLARTRPTAVNLFWALDRMSRTVKGGGRDPVALCGAIASCAFAIHEEELRIEFALSGNGADLLRDGMTVLTHCNAGGLATAGYGTALGVIYRAVEQGKRIAVYADETRPLLQGARLTAWELMKRGIDVTVLCDGAAASLCASGKIDAVIVGADRIAGNGDTANKIGTLTLAVLCGRFGIPFYVAAPWSTFDVSIGTGKEIPIEERDASEVGSFSGSPTVPEGAVIYNPAFDVTPASLITAIITERGVITRPSAAKIAAELSNPGDGPPPQGG